MARLCFGAALPCEHRRYPRMSEPVARSRPVSMSRMSLATSGCGLVPPVTRSHVVRPDAALAGADLPSFRGERVRVMLRENLVHFFHQIEPLESQMAVSVLEPAQTEIVVLGFRLSGLSNFRD